MTYLVFYVLIWFVLRKPWTFFAGLVGFGLYIGPPYTVPCCWYGLHIHQLFLIGLYGLVCPWVILYCSLLLQLGLFYAVVSQQLLLVDLVCFGLVWFVHRSAINCPCGLVWFAHSQVGFNLHTDQPSTVPWCFWFGLPGLKLPFFFKTQIKIKLLNPFPFLAITIYNFIF